MIPIIRCGFGIGNRVATMANALSRHDQIQFSWKVNSMLPMTHRQVFPDGIEGVEFLDDAPRGFATRWERHVPGESWEAAGDRARADAAYGRIMEAMAGAPSPDPPPVAIIARFWRFPEADAVALAEEAACHGRQVFLLADSRRDIIARHLAWVGSSAVMPAGGEMAGDMDRTPASCLAYMGDWKTATLAETIITHLRETSVTYPARARGARIVTAGRQPSERCPAL